MTLSPPPSEAPSLSPRGRSPTGPAEHLAVHGTTTGRTLARTATAVTPRHTSR